MPLLKMVSLVKIGPATGVEKDMRNLRLGVREFPTPLRQAQNWKTTEYKATDSEGNTHVVMLSKGEGRFQGSKGFGGTGGGLPDIWKPIWKLSVDGGNNGFYKSQRSALNGVEKALRAQRIKSIRKASRAEQAIDKHMGIETHE